MSQPIRTSSDQCRTKKEETDKEDCPRRGRRPVAQEYQKYRTGGSARSCMKTNSEEDEIASILEECLSVFQSGLLHDIKTDDLVFCEPSKDSNSEDDLHTPPPLQSHATTNTQFLQYQTWVKDLSIAAENLECEGFERCETIKCRLLDDLRNEWSKLEQLKQRAWQLICRNAGLTIPPDPRADPSLVKEIDTCEYSRPMSCN